MRRFALCLLCAAGTLGGMAVARAETAPSTANVVVFNTQCAVCHEGECSGRLSFSSRAPTASDHIRRYAGQVPAGGIEELFAVLAHMKQQCAFYPLASGPPGNGPWRAEDLAEFALASRRGYFVPLGTLPGGGYRTHLETAGATAFCVEVLGGDFELLADRCAPGGNNRLDLRFDLEKSLPVYVRLRAEQALDVIALELVPTP